MKNKEYFNIGLPKWPGLVVSGDSVTEDQAAEIIIRTNWGISSNEHNFDAKLNSYLYGVNAKPGWNSLDRAISEKLGLDPDDLKSYPKVWEWKKNEEQKFGKLDLYHLHNSRITSSWVGGPHGWCNWDGTIGTNNYNIGKYPSIESVYKDWKKIAKEFPFLNLRCQLYNHEIGYPDMAQDPGPVIEFVVSSGKVIMKIPTEFIETGEFGNGSLIDMVLMDRRSEIGCTYDQFVYGVDLVKEKMKDHGK